MTPTAPKSSDKDSAALTEWLGRVRTSFRESRSRGGGVTRGTVHVRERVNVRGLSTVALLALLPCLLFGLYNTGLQMNLAVDAGAEYQPTWQSRVAGTLGLPLLDSGSVPACFLHGLIYFLPLWIVIHLAGRASDIVFASVRREPLHEGFTVISALFALTLHPNVPLWQAALAILFGNVAGKEIFGGAGRNVIHPVVLAWNFLWIAYPATLSGDAEWFPVSPAPHSWLNRVGNEGPQILDGLHWALGLLGLTPGTFGTPAPLACLIGALVLVAAGVASWRVVISYAAGSAVASLLLNQVETAENFFIPVTFAWHMVLGSWAFGGAFLLTDPVTGAHTRAGRWIYGFTAGVFVILVRVLNPTHTDGTLAALLFVSLFAAAIDDVVVRFNIRRRKKRYEAA